MDFFHGHAIMICVASGLAGCCWG